MLEIKPTEQTFLIAHSGDDSVVHPVVIQPGQVCSTGQPHLDPPEDVHAAVASRAKQMFADWEPGEELGKGEVRVWNDKLTEVLEKHKATKEPGVRTRVRG